MPSRRDDIQMTPQERHDFLEHQPFGVLGTFGPSGYPHLVSIGFALDGTDRVVMSSFGAAQKVRNIERSPRASLLVETTTPYSEIRGVLLTGQARVVDDHDTVVAWWYRMKEQAAALLGPSNIPPVDDERVLAKRVLLVLDVEQVASWDHRKLAGVY
jgi:nitroimidazol reductase NimA-like FMN-containing flavoprotein (pyridoxamine 5'-phosphate oxidase superfamily)